jgi:signal transduction histidine kinase/ActR/RegA family two-component response regulator
MPKTGPADAPPSPLALQAPAGPSRGLLQPGTLQEAMFNSASFSSIATDELGVIQVFNVGAQRMLGYSAEDVINRFTPADISDPQEIVQRARDMSAEFATPIAPGFEALVFKARRGIEDIYELTYLHRDGSRLPAVVSVTALRDTAEAIIGYLLIGTDNTARKHAEAEKERVDHHLQSALLQAHRAMRDAKLAAESANRAKSEFLSNMSHELRSPLNAILGFAQLMDTGTPAPTPDQKDSIDQIMQAGWYLLELINEILDLALIESGKISMSPEPMSLAEVLADCLAMIEPQASARGIRVSWAGPACAMHVRADRTRVKQVFVNLLSNAIKYNREGGAVELSCETRPGDRVRINVRDTGLGLSEGDLAQLFQPFNRLGQAAGAEEGTGIGLVVSKRLVELMDGEIGAHSQVGEGSVFWVDLHAAEALDISGLVPLDDSAANHTLLAAPNGPRRTVLCVEDNPANMRLVRRLLLRRPDLVLIEAKDGREGVDLAASEQPDVILMDINLPGISGLTALRILAGDARTAAIPVVAISANAMPHDIAKGLAAGFFRYLTKPIRLHEFLDALDQALENHAPLRPSRGTEPT